MALLLALLLVTAPLQGQAAQPQAEVPSSAARFVGRTIEHVDILVEGTPTTDATLLGFIETRVGTPLSMAGVRETVAHLYSLGRYQEIRVEALDAGPNTVVLRYDLVPVHSVQRIQFRGNVALSEGSLRRAITDRFGSSPAVGRAANVAEMLQAHYFDRGYLAAAIRPVIEDGPDRTVLTFEIDAGTRATVRNVNIVGDPGEPRPRFLQRIDAQQGTPYQRVEVQRKLTEYVDRLRQQGWYEADGTHRITSIVEDGRAVDLSITVSRGREIAVRFEGDPLPKDRIEQLVPVRREGSIDVDLIEDSQARIAAYFHDQGYWKASVTASRVEEASRVEVVFTIQKGPRYVIEGGTSVTGNASVSMQEITPLLGDLQDGDVFRSATLDAASRAILGIYQQRGFPQAKVESAPNELPSPSPSEGRIRPVIVITEGPRMVVGEIRFTGNQAISSEILTSRLRTQSGQPYLEPRLVQDREAVLNEYLNEGYSTASVEVTPEVAEGNRVTLTFTIVEGPQSIVDHVLVTGNVRTDVRVIEREIQLKPGEPLGLDDVFETRRRLSALGLFRRIKIHEIAHGESDRYDILVEVEEAPATTVGYGAGLEINEERLVVVEGGTVEDRVELAPRGFFEVTRRNLGGRNRSISLFTRASLRGDVADEGRNFGFYEYRVIGTYREPRALFWNTDMTVTGAIERGVRSTFNFTRQGVNAEVHRRLFDPGPLLLGTLGGGRPQVRVSGRYTFSKTRVFDEQLNEEEQLRIDRAFPQFRLSIFAASISRDTRDDAIDPSSGTFLSVDGSTASRGLGGEVGFLKGYFQAQSYYRLPGRRRIVLATRVAAGLADGYPREVRTINPDGSETIEIIEDLPASERFFAGGDSTVRGFPLDSVGAPQTLTANGLPRGGNGLILANAELRVPVWGNLGAAVFVDSGNVFERVSQINLSELRASAGFGIRYHSPIGPLRFDVGFKLDRRETDTIGRRAFHLSFGHAF